MSISIDGQAFLAAVRPSLAAGDAQGLAKSVLSRWRPDEIGSFLGHRDVDIRRVAAVTLGLIGEKSSVPALARALHDVDEQVNQMAEYGLLSIWFRSGSNQAVEPFRKGVALLSAEVYPQAIALFEETTQIDPDFAEAYNQCAIAHLFMGSWQDAIADCRRAIRRMPVHFGAVAGMGHAYLQLGDLDQALRSYKQALEINPRMAAITCAVDRLELRLRRKNDSSGILNSAASDFPSTF